MVEQSKEVFYAEVLEFWTRFARFIQPTNFCSSSWESWLLRWGEQWSVRMGINLWWPGIETIFRLSSFVRETSEVVPEFWEISALSSGDDRSCHQPLPWELNRKWDASLICTSPELISIKLASYVIMWFEGQISRLPDIDLRKIIKVLSNYRAINRLVELRISHHWSSRLGIAVRFHFFCRSTVKYACQNNSKMYFGSLLRVSSRIRL